VGSSLRLMGLAREIAAGGIPARALLLAVAARSGDGGKFFPCPEMQRGDGSG
jgi:hypothetical protein